MPSTLPWVGLVAGRMRAKAEGYEVPIGTPYEPVGVEHVPGQWADGLCSCLNHVPICLTTCVVPCVPLGQVHRPGAPAPQ